MSNKRKLNDIFYQFITYISALISVLALSSIFMFVFIKGSSLLDFGLLFNDYHEKYYNGGFNGDIDFSLTPEPDNLEANEFYSSMWGIALKDAKDREGNAIIIVSYISKDSPFSNMYDKNSVDIESSIVIKEGNIVSKISYYDKPTSLTRYGAELMIKDLDTVTDIREVVYTSLGGGIRGSLLTTLFIIGLTLVLALPMGIFTAIYLNEFAKKNKITNLIRSLIETLTGVPSIIYGLMGLAVFVPFTIAITKADSANLISGSMTLAVILLPIIIRSTEESLKVIPDDLRTASLALGANKTQTTFRAVLPSAYPGIVTATLLAVGRIIGESAALIFAIGTAIKDDVSIFGRSTTLSVHIWSLMKDEPANIELASTIALIILIIVLALNILVKLVSKKFITKIV
ncbi:phosphate ABC transporter, permease protein PstA [Candidatus Izimaplasma bacterium ZiA1]|nr:phosphate ABC transporter, permease protein PstA [Candidatus Izimaplasma bacterium ZiA1]